MIMESPGNGENTIRKENRQKLKRVRVLLDEVSLRPESCSRILNTLELDKKFNICTCCSGLRHCIACMLRAQISESAFDSLFIIKKRYGPSERIENAIKSSFLR